MGDGNSETQSQEVLEYLNNPEHQLLNHLMARVVCPEKRRKILETFDLVADTPDRIEEIRASVLAGGK